MDPVEGYIRYLSNVRRYSDRTVSLYRHALMDYISFITSKEHLSFADDVTACLNPSELREYVVYMLESDTPKSPKTVNLHLSALSSFCTYLMKCGLMNSNPVKVIPKPKVGKRLPNFVKKDALDIYFSRTSHYVTDSSYETFASGWNTSSGKDFYSGLLERLIVSVLYSLGIRRAELINLRIIDIDFSRKVVKVKGKGDKMREIPLVASLSEEILLYLKSVEAMCGGARSVEQPLFVTYSGKPLYPTYVDRAIKSAFSNEKGIKGRKSPHVLRHSLATELMNEDAGLNSIKELLGHSSLAATQVYTHSSIARLKDSYEHAHPRAKNGGKNGD